MLANLIQLSCPNCGEKGSFDGYTLDEKSLEAIRKEVRTDNRIISDYWSALHYLAEKKKLKWDHDGDIWWQRNVWGEYIAPKRQAYTAIVTPEGSPHPFGIGLATEGESGYMPRPDCGYFDLYTYAQKEADELNEDEFNLTQIEASRIVIGTMQPHRVGDKYA